MDVRAAKSMFDDAIEVAFVAQNLIGSEHFEARFVEVPKSYFMTVTVKDWPWKFWPKGH